MPLIEKFSTFLLLIGTLKQEKPGGLKLETGLKERCTMVTQEIIASFTPFDQPSAIYQQQYTQRKVLFYAQPPAVQQTLEIQARLIAKGIEERRSPLYFVLPERIACESKGDGQIQLLPLPAGWCEQKIGDLLGCLSILDLERRLTTLEAEANSAVATGAGLLRFLVALSLVRGVFPGDPREWVVFDENNNLLVNSIDEAREKISSMHHYQDMLMNAQVLAPYIVVDTDFLRKRYGFQRQLTNQGRALAHHELGEIIRAIRKRVEAHTLDRGFSLNLPYFDDQDLEMKIHQFEIIPAGRVGFDSFFVVWAARYQQTEVSNLKKISPSTGKHLIDLLKTLERAFAKPAQRARGL
jgi:hypothetical protein